MDYIIRTLQSHHWGHCECTGYFLHQGNSKEISLKNYECTSSAQVGIWWVLCPCPCSVFAVYQPSTPPLAPSVTECPSPRDKPLEPVKPAEYLLVLAEILEDYEEPDNTPVAPRPIALEIETFDQLPPDDLTTLETPCTTVAACNGYSLQDKWSPPWTYASFPWFPTIPDL